MPVIVRDHAGQPMTIADLPSRDVRWTPGRKVDLVNAIRGGLISLPEALERYALTHEEFETWCRRADAHGLAGLRNNRVGAYREKERGEQESHAS